MLHIRLFPLTLWVVARFLWKTIGKNFWCLLTILFYHTLTSIDAGKKSRSIWPVPVPLWQILFLKNKKTRKKHPWPFIVAKALEKELESLLYKCIYCNRQLEMLHLGNLFKWILSMIQAFQRILLFYFCRLEPIF